MSTTIKIEGSEGSNMLKGEIYLLYKTNLVYNNKTEKYILETSESNNNNNIQLKDITFVLKPSQDYGYLEKDNFYKVNVGDTISEKMPLDIFKLSYTDEVNFGLNQKYHEDAQKTIKMLMDNNTSLQNELAKTKINNLDAVENRFEHEYLGTKMMIKIDDKLDMIMPKLNYKDIQNVYNNHGMNLNLLNNWLQILQSEHDLLKNTYEPYYRDIFNVANKFMELNKKHKDNNIDFVNYVKPIIDNYTEIIDSNNKIQTLIKNIKTEIEIEIKKEKEGKNKTKKHP